MVKTMRASILVLGPLLARETEVVDLAHCLIAMGTRISGAGTDIISIEGVERLHGSTHSIMPDHFETNTYLCAAAVTGGNIRLTNTSAAYLDSLAQKLRKRGCEVRLHPPDRHRRPASRHRHGRAGDPCVANRRGTASSILGLPRATLPCKSRSRFRAS